MKLRRFCEFYGNGQQLLEAKGDNLHQFVQYMKEHGREGELRTNVRDVEDYMLETNEYTVDTIDVLQDYDTYQLAVLVCDYLYDAGDEVRDFSELENCDDLMGEYISDKDDFQEWLIERACGQIFEYLETNPRGLIYIEREIAMPKFAGTDRFYDELQKEYGGRLGTFWTYKKGNARAQWPNHSSGDYVTLVGHVRPEDVDWTQTICANLRQEDELELNIKKDADIELDEIRTSNGHPIFKGTLLYKA